ncbi:hypothetical protein PHISCL_10280 [Aspergillus sclerotialis]|uniref:DUF2268 domain-containing protein n=1 Tax=Aspergillus sclerotialis TaxID=2070753 RepID=A0A3A2Z2S7_9EURO|nr:hypothetical protein PHISCL_10280 [Aspergillus sclerotialis]
MTLHFINARHQLSGIKDWLTDSLGTAFAASAALLPLGDTDVIITGGNRVIPEKGHLGYAPEKGVIYVTVDPDHASLRANPDQSLERMLAHELHHCSRWDGPGYGTTLGETLISEGLAGHFAQEVFNWQPEPWESVEPRFCGHMSQGHGRNGITPDMDMKSGSSVQPRYRDGWATLWGISSCRAT